MSVPRTQRVICAACRLHEAILYKQNLRLRRSTTTLAAGSRSFHTTTPRSLRRRTTLDGRSRSSQELPSSRNKAAGSGKDSLTAHDFFQSQISNEDVARLAREQYGDRLPDGLLSEEQGRIYERLYGRPLKLVEDMPTREGDTTAQRVEIDMDELVDSEALVEEETDGMDTRIDEDAEYDEEDEFDESGPRSHPLTIANRFTTPSSTVQLPVETLVKPIMEVTENATGKHVRQTAERLFGGIGLPHSAATPALAKTMEQRPIALDVSQARMSDVEADVFAQALMPPFYSSILSVLVETRKRLGTPWAESLVRKAQAGKLRILDAGGAGMGVLALRDMLRAEWERMVEEETQAPDFSQAIARPSGRMGGEGIKPPTGSATVLVASHALRHRTMQMLDNTTFIPRLPDYNHTEDAKHTGKFDIVIAAHTIWPLQEAWQRKSHVDNLWSLLSVDGGVLCLLEKGVARGFEAVAEARARLLRNRIETPELEQGLEASEVEGDAGQEFISRQKETGMIIAPCTNHVECPMYKGNSTGRIHARKDICHFRQRYIRPPFLQRIIGARDKNHEDVKFSYLSVLRGRDMRSDEQTDPIFASEPVVEQGEAATRKAFAGFGDASLPEQFMAAASAPSSMSLPRAILPSMKRRGHVILGVCTPSGKLEQWTVPRSFSKQAFRDARKSVWGDLWALGAKTRVSRTAKVGKHAQPAGELEKKELTKKQMKEKRHTKERKANKRGQILDYD